MRRSIKRAKAGKGQVAKKEAPVEPLGDWFLDRVALRTLWQSVVGRHGSEAERDRALAGVETVVARHARELSGPNPSPIEATLARVAAANAFYLQVFDMICVSELGSDKSLATFEKMWRRSDRAHRRLLATLRTLATVRKLAAPTIQVNIAGQQVNQVHAAAIEAEDVRPCLTAKARKH